MRENYRIVFQMDDTWIIQKRYGREWMSVHHCEIKGEQGYYEAKAWINRKEGEK